MAKVTILHISDFHWTASKRADMKIVVDALCRDIEKHYSDGLSADLVIFTGDLVQEGETEADFEHARNELFNPVLAATKLTADKLFVAPGNHDISRDWVRKNDLLEVGLRGSLIGVDAANKFIDALASGDEVGKLAVARLKNFDAFTNASLPVTPIRNSTLLRTFSVDIATYKVGIACFNTAWRASGEKDNVDRHRLLIGERNVDFALQDLAHSDIRIAAFHHPLDWLADFDETAVSSRMYSGFDLLMYGHTHRSFPEGRETPVGRSVLSQAGTLYQKRDYFNGYQFIVLDPDVEQAEFIIRTYFDTPRREFDKALNVTGQGRFTVPFRLHNQLGDRHPRVERVLRDARPIIRATASEHISLVEPQEERSLEIKEAFVCPPLTLRRSAALRPNVEEPTEPASTTVRAHEATLEDLLRRPENIMFVGQREAGKTSLAHYAAILCAEGVSDRPRIPVVIDFRNLKNGRYGLSRAIHSYLSGAMTSGEVDGAIDGGDLLFFIDNFNGTSQDAREKFLATMNVASKCRWFYFVDSQPGAVLEARRSDILPDFLAVHIEQMPRKLIREMSRRWSEHNGGDSEKLFEIVMKQIRNDNLPRTGYMVTLLLWAAYNEKRLEKINEAVLLNNILDYLLGKADFEKALRREFDPVSKEITLQALSAFLRQRFGVAPVDDVVTFLSNFFHQKGLKYPATDILQKLEDCGVLTRIGDEIAFKYRCFEEYFYAGLLRDDPRELQIILKDGTFIDYQRELDLLSGLRRRNSDLLAAISEALQKRIPEDLKAVDLNGFAEVASAESAIPLSRTKLQDIKRKRITSTQIDDLMDAADRSIAKREQRRGPKSKAKSDSKGIADGRQAESTQETALIGPMNFLNFTMAISLFGRVIRNSEFTDAQEKAPATRLYVQSWVRAFLFFSDVLSSIFNELQSEKKEGGWLGDEEMAVLGYLIRKILMLTIQESVSEEIGTEKLFGIYEDLISDEATIEAERILLSMLLLDLAHPEWKKYWEDMIDRNAKSRFVLDVLTDKIWRFIHSRPLGDSERNALTSVALEIERGYGGKTPVKGEFMREVGQRIADVQRADE